MDSPNTSLKKLNSKLEEIGLDKNPLVREAIRQAQRSHKGQKRDDHSSYLHQHIYPVTLAVVRYCQEFDKKIAPELVAGALLHDTLEDDERINEIEFKAKFGKKVFEIVKILSKPDYHDYPGRTKQDKKTARNDEYIRRIEQAPQEVRIIKFCDRENNLSCLKQTKRKKKEYYLKETKQYYIPLAKKTSEFFTEKFKEKVVKH